MALCDDVERDALPTSLPQRAARSYTPSTSASEVWACVSILWNDMT